MLGRRTIVRIAGPAGIGKTSVLSDVAKRFGSGARLAGASSARRIEPGFVARLLVGHHRTGSEAVSSFRAVLRAIASERGLLLIDDVQWMDEQSLFVLQSVLKSPVPLAVVLTDQRPYAPELPAHETIDLAPLRPSASLALVRRTYPGISSSVADEIVAAGGGVPFTLTFLALDAASRAVALPSDATLSVAQVMRGRLARLPRLSRDAATLLSFAETPAPLHILSAALGASTEDTATAVNELGDLVILDDSAAAFRHSTLSTAVAHLATNAVAANARLLAAYEREPDSLAAVVRCAIGCGKPRRAAAAALELARSLAHAGSLRAALHYAEQAMRWAQSPPAVEYVVEHAVILQLLSRDDEAAGLLRDAVRTAIARADAPAAAELAASLFNPVVTLERFTELEHLCRRIEELPSCSPSARKRVRGVRLAALAYAGRFEDYLQLAGATQTDWIDARAAAFVSALRGDLARAADEIDTYTAGLESRHARQRSPDRILDAIVSFFYFGTRALDGFEQRLADETRHPSERALCALRAICDGRWSEARGLLEETHGGGDAPSQVLEVRLLLAALSADASADEGSLATLRSMIRQRRIRHAVASARWYVVAKGGDAAADIEAFVRETLDVAPMPYSFTGSPYSTARLQDRYGAPRCLKAIERYPSFDTPWHRAHREFALGLIESSTKRLRAARDAFEALNCSALTTIAGISLPVPRSRDVAAARALGFSSTAERPRIALTDRELAVAERTARGASNQEIAAALAISVRTVETHLTKIYAKFGVRSRGAMTAVMHEHFL